MKAKQIVVYDAVAADCHVTAEAAREVFSRAGVPAVVREFTDDETFVYHFRDNHCDMAFVGVGSILDIETARGIRGLDEGCPLYLVSEKAEYALEGYRLSALDFLVKPVTAARVQEAVNRAGRPPGGKKAHNQTAFARKQEEEPV